MWGHFMVCCLCSIFYSGDALKGTRRLWTKSSPFFLHITSDWAELSLVINFQTAQWVVSGFFFLEFIWCICWKCCYPIIIVHFLILSGNAIQGNIRWKGADCLTFLKGRGVLNVTTVSLCDNMEILTFLWFGIQSVRVTDRAKLKISPTECSWILYITTTVNILWLFIGGQQLNNCICHRHLSDFKAN